MNDCLEQGLEKSHLRISIYSRPFFPGVGGVEFTTRLLARTLSELDHSVVVVTTTELPPGKDELVEGYRVLRARGLVNIAQAFMCSDLVILKGGVTLRGGGVSRAVGSRYAIVHEMSKCDVVPPYRLKQKLRANLVHNAAFHVAVSHACLEFPAFTLLLSITCGLQRGRSKTLGVIELSRHQQARVRRTLRRAIDSNERAVRTF